MKASRLSPREENKGSCRKAGSEGRKGNGRGYRSELQCHVRGENIIGFFFTMASSAAYILRSLPRLPRASTTHGERWSPSLNSSVSSAADSKLPLAVGLVGMVLCTGFGNVLS